MLKMSQNLKSNQFTVVHQLKGRLNFIVPCLYRDKERSTILQISLLKREAIEEVQINSESNLVKIYFDSVKLPKEKLLKGCEMRQSRKLFLNRWVSSAFCALF